MAEFHFPEIKINHDSPLAQIAKVLEEAGECLQEILSHQNNPTLNAPVERMCEEAWDTLQSSESLVRLLKRKFPAHMACAEFSVVQKCKDRGYYEVP